MQFKKNQLVRRKESHKNEWWSFHPDTDYVVMHDTEDAYDTVYVYPVGETTDKFLSVYIDSMELID